MMHIRVIQPPYPKCAEDTPACVSFMIQQLRLCDESLDLILLPECCNAPSGCGDSSLLRSLVAEHTGQLLDAVKETAIRCKAVVGINLYVYGRDHENQVRNSTLLFDSKGDLAAQYDKQHLPASEYTNDAIDHSYLEGGSNPFCAEVEGVRYAFLTCYDMYYSEFIHRISLEKPDVVLVCSLQRAERPDILEVQGKNTAFVCNSYVVRSSYHMGSDAKTGGCSMVVAPDGIVLRNFGQEKGSFDCQVEDIHWKYRRSNGFGQPQVTNDVYQTLYRTPWCYRVGGSGVRQTNPRMGFPRIGAKGGIPLAAPENTLPGIGMAVAMGADEVAVDVCLTADNVPVLSRDPQGTIRAMTWEAVQKLDIGSSFAPCFGGLGYARAEDLFAAFPRRTVFHLNISEQAGVADYRPLIRSLLALAEHYDCPEHFYICSTSCAVLAAAAEAAPNVERCLICREADSVAEALKLGCTRIQTDTAAAEPVLKAAKAAALRCNLVLSGGSAQAEQWLNAGADCVLTENYLSLSKLRKT